MQNTTWLYMINGGIMNSLQPERRKELIIEFVRRDRTSEAIVSQSQMPGDTMTVTIFMSQIKSTSQSRNYTPMLLIQFHESQYQFKKTFAKGAEVVKTARLLPWFSKFEVTKVPACIIFQSCHTSFLSRTLMSLQDTQGFQ